MNKTPLLTAAACLISQMAFAHAFLDRASPAVGSEVTGSPPTHANGARVDEGKPTPQDDGRVLLITLKSLPPGVYSVEWHVTSVDTHKTEGHFVFTVKP
jgi:methionine-rich copper-binding protein CopC